MGHDHHHGDAGSYYLEQLFTIAVCGAIGAVMVILVFTDRIQYLFAKVTEQHQRVLYGGLGLLAIVLIRAVYVWFAVGDPKAVAQHSHDHDHGDCDHDHDHGHAHDHTGCDHDHTHEHTHAAAEHAVTTTAPSPTPLTLTHEHAHGGLTHTHSHEHAHVHGHGHDHDHGWAPWRFVLLLLPVILFFLGFPRAGFSGTQLRGADMGQFDQSVSAVGDKGKVDRLTFKELEDASRTPMQREFYEGKTVSLTGIFVGNDPQRFTLVRYSLNCCAADSIPVNAVIMINPEVAEKYKLTPSEYEKKWVEVTGRIHFFNRRGSNEYVSGLILYPDEKSSLSELVKPTKADPYPWAN